MRFIHTADLHIDSPLRGLAAYPDAPAERLRTATRDALVQLVTRSIEEAVDFMVIAGDVYDGDWRDFNTGLFFVRQMGRLRQAGIPVFLLYGNHDAASDMTRSLELPDNVSVFSTQHAETFTMPEKKVALHGRSFKVAATTDNWVPDYPPPVAGWLNIGVLHTALEGNAAHARYAPCSVAELQAKGYQYWALGHVHEPWVQQGPVTIAYPGNLQGRHIRETGPRGALLVSADDGEITAVERLEVDVLRWHRLELDLGATPDAGAAMRAVGAALEQCLAATPGQRPLAVRVCLKGLGAGHATWRMDPGQLRQEVIAQAVALDADRLWIEKVELAQAPHAAVAPDSDVAVQGGLAELLALARSAHEDPELVRALQTDWRALLDKLPSDVKSAVADLQTLREPSLDEVRARLDAATQLIVGQVGPSAD